MTSDGPAPGASVPRTSSLQPLSRPRLYEHLVEELLTFIETQALRPGQRLPPERELATRLRVSRASISQALVALEVQGVVDVRHGDGAVVLDTSAGGAQVLAALRARRARLPEVIEARQALEVKLAELAARRRTEDDLARIDAALAQMAREIAAGQRGESGDEAFHGAVTAAAHSGLLEVLMGEIAPAILESRVESLSQPQRPAASLRGHRAIAEAIRRGDPQGAASTMREHLDLVSDVALLRQGPPPAPWSGRPGPAAGC